MSRERLTEEKNQLASRLSEADEMRRVLEDKLCEEEGKRRILDLQLAQVIILRFQFE